MSEGIKNKLYQYEIAPPTRVWEKIATALDESVPHEDISSKLYTAEVIPPAAVWNKIQATLESEPAIPLKQRRISPLFRYAAAAVLIGLVAFGTIRLINTNKTSDAIADKKIIVPSNDLPAVVKEEPVVTTDEARNDAALEESKKTYAKLDIPKKKRVDMASSFHFTNYVEPIDPVMSASNIADRYYVLMTPEGNFIRVSKKLGNMVCCVSGEEVDEDCKDQMEKWKKQLACSSASHPGNFGDILSLLSSLQQD